MYINAAAAGPGPLDIDQRTEDGDNLVFFKNCFDSKVDKTKFLNAYFSAIYFRKDCKCIAHSEKIGYP